MPDPSAARWAPLEAAAAQLAAHVVRRLAGEHQPHPAVLLAVLDVAELLLRLVGVLDGLDARNPRLEPATVRVVVLQLVVGEADAAAPVGLDQPARGAPADPHHVQTLDQPGNATGRE